MKKLIFACCAVFALVGHSAEAGYWGYSDIVAKPKAEQTLYISGVVDTWASVRDDWNLCLGTKLKMMSGQIATNILAFAASRPKLHSQSFPEIVFAYLDEACPKPPAKTP